MPEAPIPVASGGPQGEFRGVWRGGVSGSPGPEGGLWGWILGGGVWGPHSPAERCAVRSCCLCVAAACGAPAQRTAAPDVGLGWQQKRWFFSPKKLCASSSSAPPPLPFSPGQAQRQAGRGAAPGGGAGWVSRPPPHPGPGSAGKGGGASGSNGTRRCVCVRVPPLAHPVSPSPGLCFWRCFSRIFFFRGTHEAGGVGGWGVSAEHAPPPSLSG